MPTYGLAGTPAIRVARAIVKLGYALLGNAETSAPAFVIASLAFRSNKSIIGAKKTHTFMLPGL